MQCPLRTSSLQPNLSYDVAQFNRPFNELDNDEDAYVDCEITGSWRGSLSVVGGDDDYDTTVYPNATEVCDGQYNDCTATTNIAVGAPDDELDNDGDGWVECTRKPDGQLELSSNLAEPNVYGYGDDGTETGMPLCVCEDTGCQSSCLTAMVPLAPLSALVIQWSRWRTVTVTTKMVLPIHTQLKMNTIRTTTTTLISACVMKTETALEALLQATAMPSRDQTATT